MKKIITLFFAVALFGAAAFAQTRRSNYDNGYNSYSSNSYGYTTPYNNDWNNYGRSNQYDYNRKFDRDRHHKYDRDRYDRYNYRERRYYDRDDRFRNRKRVSLQIVIGSRF